MSCPTAESTAALKDIVRAASVPIVADIHFHYKRALEAADAGAACLRINPGNIGSEERVREVIAAARANGCAIRIGVNAGSLEKDLLEKYGEPCPEALVESALDHIRILEDHGFREYKVAVKASDVFLAVAAYQQLADQVDCPLHLGITEAGGLIGGTVKSSIGIGSLLWAGIGDTIRVSLSAEPEEEVRVGYEILKSLGIRSRGVRVVSCPSCARQGFDVIRTVEALEERLQHIKTPMSLSVLGCVVNGPGEARETDIGITGGGNGTHMVYLSGVTDHHMQGWRHDRPHRHAWSKPRRPRSRRRRTAKRRSTPPNRFSAFFTCPGATSRHGQAAVDPVSDRRARPGPCLGEFRAAAADRLLAFDTRQRYASRRAPTRLLSAAREPRPQLPVQASWCACWRIALFSGMDAVMKGLVLAIGTFTTMFWRNLIGIAISGTAYLPSVVGLAVARDDAHPPARGVLSTAMGFLFFWGIGRVPLAQAIALAFIAPLIALYLAAVMLDETIGRRTVGAR